MELKIFSSLRRCLCGQIEGCNFRFSVDVRWRSQSSVWQYISFCAASFWVSFLFSSSKIIGSASEADWSFGTVLKVGQVVTGAIASIACTVGHCHAPGRSEYSVTPLKTVEIGPGLHNEPVSNYNYSEHVTWNLASIIYNLIFREFGLITFNFQLQNLSSSSSSSDMGDPERASVLFSLSEWLCPPCQLVHWRYAPSLMKFSCN